MHHQRVAQEKNKLISDIKRLKKHYEHYEPTLKQLQHKYEVVMKEKMLMKLERDRLSAQVLFCKYITWRLMLWMVAQSLLKKPQKYPVDHLKFLHLNCPVLIVIHMKRKLHKWRKMARMFHCHLMIGRIQPRRLTFQSSNPIRSKSHRLLKHILWLSRGNWSLMIY